MDWQSIDTAPEWPTRVDLWMDIAASPRSFGMGDSFRVTDAYRRGAKWFHVYRGAEAELFSDYITHWMPLPAAPQATP